MAQWISIEEAAAKYGFETEYIWVLIEMREITVDYERPGIDIISDDSVQEFMSRNERGATLMYIEKLERYCIDKSKLCSIYLSLLGKQDKEITRYTNQMVETMWPIAEVGKRTRLGADYLLYLLAEKNLYENQEVKSDYLFSTRSMLLNNRDREHQQPVKLLYGSLQLYKKLQVLLFFL